MADSSTTVQKISAEVLGTFVLVFFGCGTAIFSGGDYVAIGLAFGLTVLAGAYAFGRISGAHFNPAVSVGAALGGRMAWRQVPVYVGCSARRAPWSPAWRCSSWSRASTATTSASRAGPEQLRRRRHRLRVVGGVPGRDHPDRDLRLRDPRRHRRPQRAPGPGARRDRPDPDDDPLRVDHLTGTSVNPARSIGVGHLRRQRRDHPALAVHRRAAGRRCDRRHHLPADLRPRHRPGARLGAELRPARAGRGARLRRARPVPAGVEPAADRPGPGRVGAGADHPGRLAVGPRRSGVEAPGAVAGPHRRPRPPRRRPRPRIRRLRRRPLRPSPLRRSPLPRLSSRRSRTRARRPPSSAHRSERARARVSSDALCSSAM